MRTKDTLHLLSFRPHIRIVYVLALVNWRELVFANTAQWAFEIFRKVFKCCARLNASLWHAYFWVVLPSADIANVLFHKVNNFKASFNGRKGDYLKYLLYRPWKPAPWRASSFAIS